MVTRTTYTAFFPWATPPFSWQQVLNLQVDQTEIVLLLFYCPKFYVEYADNKSRIFIVSVSHEIKPVMVVQSQSDILTYVNITVGTITPQQNGPGFKPVQRPFCVEFARSPLYSPLSTVQMHAENRFIARIDNLPDAWLERCTWPRWPVALSPHPPASSPASSLSPSLHVPWKSCDLTWKQNKSMKHSKIDIYHWFYHHSIPSAIWDMYVNKYFVNKWVNNWKAS